MKAVFLPPKVANLINTTDSVAGVASATRSNLAYLLGMLEQILENSDDDAEEEEVLELEQLAACMSIMLEAHPETQLLYLVGAKHVEDVALRFNVGDNETLDTDFDTNTDFDFDDYLAREAANEPCSECGQYGC